MMGCYGLGCRVLRRLWSSLTTKMGLWLRCTLPRHYYHPNVADAQQIEAAEHLYTQLNSSGIETLLDDRDERAGVKFNADLIGIPYRL